MLTRIDDRLENSPRSRTNFDLNITPLLAKEPTSPTSLRLKI